MFPQMAKSRIDIKKSAIQYYIQNKTTLQKTAEKFGIHLCTLSKWLQRYHISGEVSLLAQYHRPWNRTSTMLERRIKMIKEKDLFLTVRRAQVLLCEQGVDISLKGIWSIWKRYGLAGFEKKKLGDDFIKYSTQTQEAAVKLKHAAYMLENEQKKQAAMILNSIPFLQHNEVLSRIPDRYLGLPRRIEKIAGQFGRVAIRSYLKNLHRLYKQLLAKGMILSALRVGYMEVLALEWSYLPVEQLQRIKELQNMLKRKKEYASYNIFQMKFQMLVSEAIACTQLARLQRAVSITRRCQRMLVHRRKTSPQLLFDMSVLYTYMEEFRKAGHYLEQYLLTQDEKTRERMRAARANILYSGGKYRELKRLIRQDMFQYDWGIKPRLLMFQAFIELMEGRPQKAITRAAESLIRARTAEINGLIYQAYMLIACSHGSMGDSRKAKKILKRLTRFLKRKNLKKYMPVLLLLLGEKPKGKHVYPKGLDILPREKLSLLLYHGYFTMAYHYAQRKNILTGFYQYAFFFPNDINKRLQKGRPTFLPNSVLSMPVFNRAKRVYTINILGPLRVYCNKKRQQIRLSPQEQAVLVSIAYRCNAPGSRLSVKSICANFWPDNPHASRHLSRRLVSIRKDLRLPRHLLAITQHDGERMLVNRGCYFILDHDELKESIATARALVRAQEHTLAKQEYARAMKLRRGQPCEKLYDPWSDTLRQAIMNLFEHATEEYGKL